jgi:hypothetical protein
MRFIIHNAEKPSYGVLRSISADGYHGIYRYTGAGEEYVIRTNQRRKVFMISNSQYTWAPIFIEVALHACRHVHLDYQRWGQANNWQDPPAYDTINISDGIELADEPTVCAAITQAYAVSPIARYARTPFNFQDLEKRNWEIAREHQYKKSQCRADIYLREVKATIPVYIEAKRLKSVSTKLLNEVSKSPVDQVPSIVADVEKLKKEADVHRHLLVWHHGAVQLNGEIDFSPENLVAEVGILGHKINVHQQRYSALNFTTKVFGPKERPKKMFWIGLFEVL